QIKKLPPVVGGYIAIPAVKPPVVGIRVAYGRGTLNCRLSPGVADAMGPGVISTDRHTPCSPAFSSQDQTVVIACPAGLHVIYRTKILPERRILQTEPAALIRTRCCRA